MYSWNEIIQIQNSTGFFVGGNEGGCLISVEVSVDTEATTDTLLPYCQQPWISAANASHVTFRSLHTARVVCVCVCV